MIKIGQNIGAINTVLLIIFTAVLGIYFAKLQGIKTLKSGIVNMYVLLGFIIGYNLGKKKKAVPGFIFILP